MYAVRDLSKNAQHGVLLGVARVWDVRDIVSTFRKMSTKPDQAQSLRWLKHQGTALRI